LLGLRHVVFGAEPVLAWNPMRQDRWGEFALESGEICWDDDKEWAWRMPSPGVEPIAQKSDADCPLSRRRVVCVNWPGNLLVVRIVEAGLVFHSMLCFAWKFGLTDFWRSSIELCHQKRADRDASAECGEA
jgi:hypothetical protein